MAEGGDAARRREPGLQFAIRHLARTRPGAPDEPPSWSSGMLGVLPAFRAEPLRTLQQAAAIGDVVRLPMGHPRLSVPAYLVTHPDGIQQVLMGRPGVYRKSFTNLPARSIFGLGLLTSDGQSWVDQRRILRPVFHRDRLDALQPAVARTCDELLERWHGAARRGDVLDLGAEMGRTSLDILLRSTFGMELGQAGMRAVATAFPVLSQQSWRRTVSPLWWFFPRFAESVPTRQNRAFHRAQRLLDGVVGELIAAPHSGDRASLLSVLLEAREEGRPLSRNLIRDEIVTFLIAGHETTATSLAWALYLLGRSDPAWQRLHAEVSAAGHRPGEGDRTRAVVMEALRLYPPAWSIVRDAVEEDRIDGFRIPAGSVVITSPFVTQRDLRFWDRPDEFLPERFEAGAGGDHPQFAYFPFGGGMRHCIGEHLAMQQAVDVVARIARSFRPVPRDRAPILPTPAVTLRPSRPILARLVEH